jgi:hypothetical protein
MPSGSGHSWTLATGLLGALGHGLGVDLLDPGPHHAA